MNRLDISFESDHTYGEIVSNSAKDGFEIITRDEYVATVEVQLAQDRAVAAPWQHLEISQEETELGRRLYRALESVKFA